MLTILDFLAEKGHKVSLSKAQLHQEVIFLGQKKQEMTGNHTKLTCKAKTPTTIHKYNQRQGLSHTQSWQNH